MPNELVPYEAGRPSLSGRVRNVAFWGTALAGATLAAGTLLHAAGWLPVALLSLGRPLAFAMLLVISAHEAVRCVEHAREPGRLRWSRLAFGLCLAAFILGMALNRMLGQAVPERGFGESAFGILGLAALADLVEDSRQRTLTRLGRIGLRIGIAAVALFAILLFWEDAVPDALWLPLFLLATLCLGAAGDIYLRVRRASAPQADGSVEAGPPPMVEESRARLR